MDIILKRSGYMACKPCHSYGPTIHDCFLFHLVLSGSGVYERRSRQYKITAGQGFLIWPGEVTFYQADACDPWAYAWLGFRGEDALQLITSMGLSEELPVWQFSLDEQLQRFYLRILHDVSRCKDMLMFRSIIAGDMLNFLTWAGHQSGTASTQSMQYCEKAMTYMRSRLSKGVSIEETCAYMGLSRSQLFRVFKKLYGQPPRKMLELTRIEQAQHMLTNTSLTLEKIAAACGYANVSHFCVAFKRTCGYSPTAYRNQAALGFDE